MATSIDFLLVFYPGTDEAFCLAEAKKYAERRAEFRFFEQWAHTSQVVDSAEYPKRLVYKVTVLNKSPGE